MLILSADCESAGYDEWKGTYNVDCFKNLDANNVAYKDLTPGNWVNRQWWWMLCNEPYVLLPPFAHHTHTPTNISVYCSFEWWQDGAPLLRPTLVSRLMNPSYWRKQCPLLFPGAKGGIAQGRRASHVNKWTGGWDVTNTTRAMHTNGERDPWRDATLSSIFRPGGPVKSTEQLPVRLVKGGVHCSDLYSPNWEVNAEVRALAEDATAQMKRWVGGFYDEKKVAKPFE